MGSSSDLLSLGFSVFTSQMRVTAPQVTTCTVNEESAFTLEVLSGQWGTRHEYAYLRCGPPCSVGGHRGSPWGRESGLGEPVAFQCRPRKAFCDSVKDLKACHTGEESDVSHDPKQ